MTETAVNYATILYKTIIEIASKSLARFLAKPELANQKPNQLKRHQIPKPK